MRGALGVLVAAPLMFVSTTHGAIPLGVINIHGKWHMRGVVVQSDGGAPRGSVDSPTWALQLLCTGSCHVRATLGVGTKHRRVVRLEQKHSVNRYNGELKKTIACEGSTGTTITRVSLRVAAAKLVHGSLVATRVTSRVTTSRMCPATTKTTVRGYQGTSAS